MHLNQETSLTDRDASNFEANDNFREIGWLREE